MHTFWQDLRFAARMLLKRPGFTIVAILTLGIGIGANSTIFTLANAVLFRPLPIHEPERVMSFYGVTPDGTRSGRFSWRDYEDYREQQESFSATSAQMQTLLTLGTGEQAELIFGEVSAGTYFSLLGVGPAVGRVFIEADDHPGADRVTVISHSLWQRRFGGEPTAVGKPIHLNGEAFTIIGVLREGYTGTRVIPAVEAWVPLQQSGTWLGPDWRTDRAQASLQVIGRLKPGVTREAAQAEVSTIAQRLAQAYPVTNKTRAIELERTSLTEGRRRAMVSAFVAILLGMTGLVLLLACANVANLILVRAIGRQREFAVRLALGAGRWRLVRMVLTEGLLLSLFGGGAGLLLSLYTASLLQSFNPLPTFPLHFDLSPDLNVLGFSLLASLLTGVLVSLAPALQSTRPNLTAALKEDSRSGSSNPRRSRLRNSFVIAQTAISLVLLVGAGLLLRSLQNLESAPPGFDPRPVFAMDFDLSLKGLTEPGGRRYYRSLLERITALPGVERASLSNRAPLDISTPTLGAEIDGHLPPPGRDNILLSFYRITPGYFQTMSIPLLQGREFSERDDESAPRVAIINETMARQFWGAEEAVGKRFRLSTEAMANAGEMNVRSQVEVVGVVKDAKYRTLGEDPTPLIYLPFWQIYNDGMTLLVRTTTEPALMMRTVRGELQRMDKDPQGFFQRTMQEHMAVVLAPGRIAATLFGLAGLVALLLASIGIYGVISFSVSQRIHEMGVRMALGARPGDILRLMVGQGLRLAAAGVGVGVLASLALTQFLSNLLFGVGTGDPLTIAAVAVILIATAALACYLPARRAVRVDPMIALRYE